MNTSTINKSVTLVASILGLMLLLTACGSSDDAAPVATDVQVSGTITNLDDTGEAAVQVEAVYTNPGDPGNPVATTNSSGGFTLQVLKDTPVFLRATKSGFATVNSAKAPFTASVTVDDIGMPTEVEAQQAIDAAFSDSRPPLQNHAWLVVDVVDAADNEVDGKQVNTQAAFQPTDEVYTNCDGTDSGQSMTVAACPADRPGPMYIAYFDVEGEIEVTVEGQKQLAPIRMGEVTALEFEVAANEFFSVSGEVTGIGGNPLQAISVEAVYTVPGDPANPTTTTDAGGIYTLDVLKNKPVYVRMTASGFAVVNTAKVELAVADLTGVDITLPTPQQAQTVIDTAFSPTVIALDNKAWLMVDVFDGSENEQPGVTISSVPAPNLDAEVYTDCDGTDSDLTETKSCPTDRGAPMYLAYFDSAGDVTVDANNKGAQTAPLTVGEITYLAF